MAYFRGGSVKQRRLRFDLDQLRDTTDLKGHVNTNRTPLGDFDRSSNVFLESRNFNRQGVNASRQVRQDVKAC